MSTSKLGWLPAEVPGHVHLDLLRAGVIADPFERMHELGVQWIDEVDWCYRCVFPFAPSSDFAQQGLRFEGLDTACSIFLNGERIGHSDNMFVPLEIDVSGRLLDGQNELRIDFESAARVGRERRTAYFGAEGLAENTSSFYERAFVRKAQYMFGWDWGPRLVSCGVWRPVTLIEHAGNRLKGVWARATVTGNTGTLTIETDRVGDGTIAHRLFGPRGDLPVHAIDGDGTIPVPSPLPWSPSGPNLYRLETMFGSETATTNIGFRTVDLVREPDDFGESFRFVVNGTPIFAKGANWIPDGSFPSTFHKAQLRKRLAEAKSLNMDMLRV